MKTQLAIQKFLDNRRAQNLKPKSIAWYEAELKRFAGAYPELPTEPEPVEEFLTTIEGVPETKHAYYRALKAFYRFIHKRYGMANPIEQIEPLEQAKIVVAEARTIADLPEYVGDRLRRLISDIERIDYVKGAIEATRNAIPDGAIEAEQERARHGSTHSLI